MKALKIVVAATLFAVLSSGCSPFAAALLLPLPAGEAAQSEETDRSEEKTSNGSRE